MEPMTILLVEDNEAHAQLTIQALRRADLANPIVHVEDGTGALDYLWNRGQYRDPGQYLRPGLILLDLKLPGVDGLEVLRQIKADPSLRLIPVVALTTSEHPRDIETAYANSVNSYIAKPVEFQQFRQVVRELGIYWVITNTPPPGR